jgi:hypothetical protein
MRYIYNSNSPPHISNNPLLRTLIESRLQYDSIRSSTSSNQITLIGFKIKVRALGLGLHYQRNHLEFAFYERYIYLLWNSRVPFHKNVI